MSPWISLGYPCNAKDVTISGKKFHVARYSVFTAVHLGWKF
jgi:hypothetical protein